MQTPVLIIAFNRADMFEKVLASVSRAEPSHLYIHIDGPKSSTDADEQAIMNSLAEDLGRRGLKISLRQLEKNLGCGGAVNSALDWFFSSEPEGIVLEDDLSPHPDFFRFCETALAAFRHDMRVGQIGGYNPAAGISRLLGYTGVVMTPRAYVWGWASWANRWESYRSLKNVVEPTPVETDSATSNIAEVKRRVPHVFSEIEKGKKLSEIGAIDTWDYPWAFEFFSRSWFCALPPTNLVENLGFDSRATHTQAGSSAPVGPLPKAWRIPRNVQVSYGFERVVHNLSRLRKRRKRLKKKLLEATVCVVSPTLWVRRLQRMRSFSSRS